MQGFHRGGAFRDRSVKDVSGESIDVEALLPGLGLERFGVRCDVLVVVGLRHKAFVGGPGDVVNGREEVGFRILRCLLLNGRQQVNPGLHTARHTGGPFVPEWEMHQVVQSFLCFRAFVQGSFKEVFDHGVGVNAHSLRVLVEGACLGKDAPEGEEVI